MSTAVDFYTFDLRAWLLDTRPGHHMSPQGGCCVDPCRIDTALCNGEMASSHPKMTIPCSFQAIRLPLLCVIFKKHIASTPIR